LLRFTDLRDRYPAVVGFGLLGRQIIVVHDPEAIEDILVKKHALFVKDEYTSQLGDVLGRGLLTSEGEQHKRNRRLVAPFLAATEVAQYASTMVERARVFAVEQAAGSVIDVRGAMMHLTLDILVRTLFGHQFSRFSVVERELESVMKAFRPRAELIRSLSPKWLPLPSRFRLRRARRVLHEVVDQLILEKRRSPGSGDLLSRLIAAREEQGSPPKAGDALTDAELRDEVMTMFLAGHETTALSLTFVLRLLSLHPECRRRVEAEVDEAFSNGAPLVEQLRALSYTHAVFQETLRLYPPAWVVGRQALQTCRVGQWQLPKGSQVFIPIYSLQRHPAWFERPDDFLPERFLPGGSAVENKPPRFVYAPFGGGPRVCVGQHFAVLEAMAALVGLLSQRRFELIPGQPFDLAPSVTLRPLHPMHMRVHAR
jgi:cytochrome P450